MKKKYENKDLNIAYNDGRQEMLKEFLEKIDKIINSFFTNNGKYWDRDMDRKDFDRLKEELKKEIKK